MPDHPVASVVDSVWERIDPTPDPRALFSEFDERFFWSSLGSVEVKWSLRMTSCAGTCSYEGRGGLCVVRLSQPLLKLRPRKDLVETLLHEMIHAYLFVTHNWKDHSDHGPKFQSHMNRINKESGANITVFHSFHNEVRHYQTHVWQCNGSCAKRHPFYGKLRRASNRAPGPNDFWWAEHQKTCGGRYIKISEPEGFKAKVKGGKSAGVGHTLGKGNMAGNGVQLGAGDHGTINGTGPGDIRSFFNPTSAGRPGQNSQTSAHSNKGASTVKGPTKPKLGGQILVGGKLVPRKDAGGISQTGGKLGIGSFQIGGKASVSGRKTSDSSGTRVNPENDEERQGRQTGTPGSTATTSRGSLSGIRPASNSKPSLSTKDKTASSTSENSARLRPANSGDSNGKTLSNETHRTTAITKRKDQIRDSSVKTKPPLSNVKHPFSNANPPLSKGKLPLFNAKPSLSNAKPSLSNAKPSLSNAKPPLSNAKPSLSNAKPPLLKANIVNSEQLSSGSTPLLRYLPGIGAVPVRGVREANLASAPKDRTKMNSVKLVFPTGGGRKLSGAGTASKSKSQQTGKRPVQTGQPSVQSNSNDGPRPQSSKKKGSLMDSSVQILFSSDDDDEVCGPHVGQPIASEHTSKYSSTSRLTNAHIAMFSSSDESDVSDSMTGRQHTDGGSHTRPKPGAKADPSTSHANSKLKGKPVSSIGDRTILLSSDDEDEDYVKEEEEEAISRDPASSSARHQESSCTRKRKSTAAEGSRSVPSKKPCPDREQLHPISYQNDSQSGFIDITGPSRINLTNGSADVKSDFLSTKTSPSGDTFETSEDIIWLDE